MARYDMKDIQTVMLNYTLVKYAYEISQAIHLKHTFAIKVKPKSFMKQTLVEFKPSDINNDTKRSRQVHKIILLSLISLNKMYLLETSRSLYCTTLTYAHIRFHLYMRTQSFTHTGAHHKISNQRDRMNNLLRFYLQP